MRFATFNQVPLADLIEMAKGNLEDTLTDFDFLETLADQHCFVVPPWVLQASAEGRLRKITRLVYNVDGELNKARILVAVAHQLGLVKSRFEPRFTI